MRLGLIFVCSLIHGLGLASALVGLGLDSGHRLWSLAGFNTGIEAAQLPVAGACGGLLWAWQRAGGTGRIARTLQWHTAMATLQEQGVTCVLEVGRGTTLSSLWNAQHPDIPARSLDQFQHPEGAVAWVKSHLDR